MKFCPLVLIVALIAAPALVAQPKVEPPVRVRTVDPVYPYELRREGIAGVVVVSCVVDTHGNAVDLAVDRSTHVGFNQAALEAVKKWKFKPAVADGVVVTQKILVPLKFTLEKT